GWITSKSQSYKYISPNTKIGSEQQRKRSGKYAKPLAGGYELLLTHQELSGSGEDHRTLRRVGPFSCKEKFKKIKNWLNDPSLLSIDQKKELEMTQALKEGLVASTSSKPAAEASKEKPKGPQKKKKGPKSHQGKGKGKENCHRPYPQGYRIPELEPSAMDSVFDMARTSMQFTAKKQERMNRTFPHK
ncbi:hypothetical protein O181_070912, partial [Austropuccinia psidii MF-1]|nr:hypothetical protein [Austropuccinia psidii MF-1]